MVNKCSYSASADMPAQVKPPLPVECPERGAIRKPLEAGSWVTGRIQWVYPEHPCLDGTARERPRYKKINGRWRVVGMAVAG